jgi:hypothetical protein
MRPATELKQHHHDADDNRGWNRRPDLKGWVRKANGKQKSERSYDNVKSSTEAFHVGLEKSRKGRNDNSAEIYLWE